MKDLFGEEVKSVEVKPMTRNLNEIKEEISKLSSWEWAELLNWMMEGSKWNGV